MQTPIADFVKSYADKKNCRMHMPGHKGAFFLGCESYDITEVFGADALYEADGIISQSEKNASELFGTKRTVYSTEGSSQCIRAMLYLAVNYKKTSEKPYILAGRNVHKSFLYAASLLDFDIVWLWPDEMHSLCSCKISPEQIQKEISVRNQKPAAVYLTCPDYLGGQLDLKAIADICHKNDTLLVVDNAHGAYLHFLNEKNHPMDLGADLCCDSVHKTLPVLTGGAYLHINKNADDFFVDNVKQAMALFGSTSPSYLILSSLDLCNRYLACYYNHRLSETVDTLESIRENLINNGWCIEQTDPLKITIKSPDGMTGNSIAQMLRTKGIECEYSDSKYVVLMITPENTRKELEKLVEILGINESRYREDENLQPIKCKQAVSVREAMFAKQELVFVDNSVGRICGVPTVGCPPAIPIVVSGEIIDDTAVDMFKYYGIKEVSVIK